MHVRNHLSFDCEPKSKRPSVWMRSFRISLTEQQEIVRLLDEQFEVIERNERELDAALKRSEALRQAILKKAFTGRLVPQVATDEPASTLLARLRTERAAAPASKRKPTLQP